MKSQVFKEKQTVNKIAKHIYLASPLKMEREEETIHVTSSILEKSS